MVTEIKNSKHYINTLKIHYLVEQILRFDGAVMRDEPGELYSLCDQILEPDVHKFTTDLSEVNCKICLKKVGMSET